MDGAAWAVVVGTVASAVVTVIGTTVIPYFTERARSRRERRFKRADSRRAAFSELLRLYAAGHALLEHASEPAWVNIAAAAGKCIPHTAPESEARKLLLELSGRKIVALDMLTTALLDE